MHMYIMRSCMYVYVYVYVCTDFGKTAIETTMYIYTIMLNHLRPLTPFLHAARNHAEETGGNRNI